MAHIQGSKVAFQVLIGDEYITLFCAKSINLRTDADVVETTTKGDGRFKDWDYDVLSASVSLEAITALQNEGNPPTLIDFWDFQYQFMEVNFRIIYTDAVDAAKIKVFRAQGIVRSNNTNASAGLIVDGTADILIKGQYFLEDAIPEYVDFNIVSFNNDTAAAQIRVQLIDTDGNIIFDTALLEEAVSGWLENPVDITKKVLIGDYYMILEVRTETENNTWLIPPPPIGMTGGFNNGINVINTEELGKPVIPFDVARQLIITLGTVVEPPPCVQPDFVGSTVLPDGEVGIPYVATFPLIGSQPFTLSDVTKPAWMNIAVVDISGTEKGVQFSGTPDAEGTGINVTVQVNNACGAVNLPQTIDITAPPVTQSTVTWSFNKTGLNAAGTFRIWVNSVQIVNVNSDNSGTFNVNPGDVIFASLVAQVEQIGSMAVVDSVDGVIFFEPGQDGTINFQWTAINGHNYDISADVQN